MEMNKVYKTVWNKNLGCSQVTSELKKGHCRGTKKSAEFKLKPIVQTLLGYARLSLFSLALLPISVMASIYDAQLPTGGNITVGSAQISQNNNTLNVHQNSQNVGINWDQFNIGREATVNFYQPNASSIAVNRVLDSNASKIMGKLNANGQVFLLNPNGVIFSKTAQVNVGGIVASTLNVNDGDIISGNFTLKNQGGKGKVENYGSVIANGGVVAFIAPTVINAGNVEADQGVIHFTAADQVTLRLQDGDLTEYQVDIGTLQGLIDNSGAVLANNGAVYLTAKARDNLSKVVVNHSGVIEANRLTQNAKGEIILLADMATGITTVSGSLKAEGQNGQDGGFIETSAANVKIDKNTQVSTQSTEGKTGTWLIDPTDFTIEGGTAAKTGSGIGAKTLENNLHSTSVIIETQSTGNEAGDIHVNADVTWNNASTLTLKAHNDINVNANITSEHSDGKVALIYGQNNNQDANYHLADGAKINLKAGQNFSTKKGGDATKNYTVITELGTEGSVTAQDLQGINGDLAGNYVLGADIDANATKNWGAEGDAGFNPLGNEFDGEFSGYFDGLGHTVSNLTIDRPYNFGVGLFGYLQDAQVRNVGVKNGSIQGDSFVGGLVGNSTNSLIENSFSHADVKGYGTIGGLVGGNYDGKIQDSYATGDVTGGAYSSYVGGLVGGNDNAHIKNSYATGNVTGDEIVGGLVGDNNNNATIQRSYTTGDVTGIQNVGGLAGNSYYGSEIKDSYAVGAVTGETIVGGLVGEILDSTLNTSYAAGKVTVNAQDAQSGGLVAKNVKGTVFNSVWDKEKTGQSTSAGSAESNGLGSEQMFNAENYTGFDFDGIWNNADNQTTAFLRGHKGSNEVKLKGEGDIAYSVIQNIHQLQAVNQKLDGHYILGNDIDARVTSTWSSGDGQGFESLGSTDQAFTGVMNGLGYQISDVFMLNEGKDQVGLIGVNKGAVKNVGVTDIQVTGRNDVGGLVGKNQGLLEGVYSTGEVRGQSKVGGLIGNNEQILQAVYSKAKVNGQDQVGGLIGLNNADIQDVYSTGNVSGQSQIGGLIGQQGINSTVKNAFTMGRVEGVTQTGAVVGHNAGTVTTTYWDKEQNTAGIGQGTDETKGLTTDEMRSADSFLFLDENSKLGGTSAVWRIYEGKTIPFLRQFLIKIDLGLKDKKTVYNGKEQLFADVLGLDTNKFVADGEIKGTNAGEYKATYYSNDQHGYDFIGNEGSLIIDKAQVTVKGSSETGKIYNGQTQSMDKPSYTVEGMVNSENQSLLGKIEVSGVSAKDAGIYKNKVSGENTETQNYDINYQDGEFVIAKKKITVTANDETREYNGALQRINSFTAEGLVAGETEDTIRNSINAVATRQDAGIYTHAVGYANTNGNNNYDISFKSGTYTITKATATVTGNSLNTVYDGKNQNVSGFNVSGLKGNDQQTVLGEIFNTAASGRNAGHYENVVGGAESSKNYNILYENGILDIAKKQVTGTISAQDKVYDGSTHAVLNGQLQDVVEGDTVNFLTTGQFIDKNAGKNKVVNVMGEITGVDAANYELVSNQQTQADIEKAKLQVIGNSLTATYSGQSNSVTGFTVEGLVGGDTELALTNVTATGASGTLAGTYYNNVSGTDQNYELVFTAGMLKIVDNAVIPDLPTTPEQPITPDEPTTPEQPITPDEPANPEEPTNSNGLNLIEYQRAIQFAPVLDQSESQSQRSTHIEIEIVGDGINMDGIQTLTGNFK